MLRSSQPDAPNEHSPTQKGVFALLILGFPLELPALGNLHVFGIQARVWQWRTILTQCLEDGGKVHIPALDGFLFCCCKKTP